MFIGDRPLRAYVGLGALVASVIGARAAAQSSAAEQRASSVAVLPGSLLTIRGSTTIGAKWHCSTDAVVANAMVRPDAASVGADAVTGVTVTVLVSALRCQSGPMERAMRKAMRAEHDAASAISGTFAAHGSTASDARAHLDGSLVVAGVERAVVLDATVSDAPDGTFRVQATVPLLLSQFAITPPRVLFGAVRARDAIAVDVDLRFPRWRRTGDIAGPVR